MVVGSWITTVILNALTTFKILCTFCSLPETEKMLWEYLASEVRSQKFLGWTNVYQQHNQNHFLSSFKGEGWRYSLIKDHLRHTWKRGKVQFQVVPANGSGGESTVLHWARYGRLPLVWGQSGLQSETLSQKQTRNTNPDRQELWTCGRSPCQAVKAPQHSTW